MSTLATTFNVLFDILGAYRARVWDLDIAAAIRSLLNQIRTVGQVDFERSGVALLSSAIIFRRKTEELLKLEEPPKHPQGDRETPAYEGPVLPIDLPVRASHPVVSSNELFSDLVEMLMRVLRERRAYTDTAEAAEDLIVPDVFLEEVGDRVEELSNRIALAIKEGGRVGVMELLARLDRVEAVRTFIVLLFVLSSMDYEIEKEGDQLWIVSERRLERA